MFSIASKPCNIFMRIFTKIPRNCNARIMEKFIFQPEFQGYVYHIRNATYCSDDREKKQWTVHNNTISHNNNNNNSNNEHNLKRNNKTKSDFVPDLSNHLEKLEIGFHDMKVDHDVLVDAVQMYAESTLDNDEIGIFLLTCCGEVMPDIKRELRQELANRMWKILEKNNPEMSLIHYHTYLDVCAQNCATIDPEKFLKGMKVLPNDDTHTCLLDIAARNGDSGSVQLILTKMKELNYSANHKTLSTLIELGARVNDMKSIYSLFESLTPTRGANLDEFSGKLAKGYALNNDIENVLKLFKSHRIEDQDLLIIMRTLSLSGDGKNIEKLFPFLLQRNKIISDPLLHNIVIELVHSDKLNDALSIINYFASNYSVDQTILLVGHFLRAIVSAKIPNDTVLNIGRALYERYSSLKILHLLLEQSLRSSNRNLSLLLLEEMRNQNLEIRPHYYWPLLKYASTNEGESGVLEILHHMKQLHVPADRQSLLYYVLPYINTLNPRNTLTRLRQLDIPISVIFKSLVSYLLQNGRISKTLSLFNMLEKTRIDSDEFAMSVLQAYKVTKDVDGCVELLKSNRKNNHSAKFLGKLVDDKSLRDDIVSVLETFVNAYARNGVYISRRDAELISELLSCKYGGSAEILESVSLTPIVQRSDVREEIATCFTGSPHPRDMNEEQLENHLIELQSKRMNTRGVFRKLFMLHCKNNNLERVGQLRQLFKQGNYTLTFGMKALLLEMYARNARTDELRNMWLDLRQNHANHTIDTSKVLMVALAFAKEDNVEMALKIIEENGKPNFESERMCWKLLNAIAASTSAHLVDSVLQLLVEDGYCKISTMCLGPLVRRHLLKNDIPSAVNVFESVASKYGKTPLHRELVIALVGNSNNNSSDNTEVQTMLQHVLKLISRINGEIAVREDLIVSYAQCGLTQNLRTALKVSDPSVFSMDKITLGMPDDIKIRVLISLLEAATEEIHWRHSIYESLLLTYCNMGELQNAINLKRDMDTEGIITSTVANKVLSDSLLRHKIQIPPDINCVPN